MHIIRFAITGCRVVKTQMTKIRKNFKQKVKPIKINETKDQVTVKEDFPH